MLRSRHLPTDVSGRRLCGLLIALWAIIIAVALASLWPLLGLGAALLFAVGCWLEHHFSAESRAARRR